MQSQYNQLYHQFNGINARLYAYDFTTLSEYKEAKNNCNWNSAESTSTFLLATDFDF